MLILQQYRQGGEVSTVVAVVIDEWLLWKRASEVVRLAVVADVTASTKGSEQELTVLVQLSEAGGRMRQNALSVSTGWDRTRLSHLLTRMESAGHLQRDRLSNGVDIRLLPAGQAVITAARPELELAIERHLLGRLDEVDRAALHRILCQLVQDKGSR
jgi:DNA-binding MarR family transcriptional regulator